MIWARPSQSLGSGYRCKSSLVPRCGLSALSLAQIQTAKYKNKTPR